MMTLIDIDQWIRKEHYLFFSQFEETFFGVIINIDCTDAYKQAKSKGYSFFLYYLYRALKAINKIENFRYRIIDKQVYLFDQINASATISRPNGTFGFAYMDYHKNELYFHKMAINEIEHVQKSTTLFPAVYEENVVHFSAVPWLDFTALSHARSFSFPDSTPKISFGKVTENNGVKTMPVSVHVHHGLMDGYHVGLFVETFQELMTKF